MEPVWLLVTPNTQMLTKMIKQICQSNIITHNGSNSDHSHITTWWLTCSMTNTTPCVTITSLFWHSMMLAPVIAISKVSKTHSLNRRIDWQKVSNDWHKLWYDRSQHMVCTGPDIYYQIKINDIVIIVTKQWTVNCGSKQSSYQYLWLVQSICS